MNRKQVVSFDARVSHEYDYDGDTADIATKAHTAKVDDLVKRLYTRVVDIEEQQHHAITREDVHRSASEAASNKVAWWSMTKMRVLTVCTVIQVWYLKSFFEVKQII